MLSELKESLARDKSILLNMIFYLVLQLEKVTASIASQFFFKK
jgi:hypothetical protein